MAKKRRKTTKNLNRRQLARREKEDRFQQRLIWAAITVVTLIVVIIGYGVVTEVFIKARRPVAIVGDEEITTREFQARQRYERRLLQLELMQYRNYLQQFDPTSEEQQTFTQQIQITINNLEKQLSPDLSAVFGGRVLDDMIEEALVRQEAAERGLTVSNQEVNRHMEEMLGYDPEAAEQGTITDTLGVDNFDELYRMFRENVLKASRYSEEDYRDLVRVNLLQQRIKEDLTDEVQEEVEQVEVTYFTTETEEAGQTLRERLNNGEIAPEELVEELNGDESEATNAAALPWLPTGYLAGQTTPQIEQIAFNTPVDRASEPALNPNDGLYYVIYVTGHEERPLSDFLLEDAREQQYTNWVEEQKEEKVEYLNWEKAVITKI